MPSEMTPSAHWDAMTDQEKITFLATEVMGWEWHEWEDETSQFDPSGRWNGACYMTTIKGWCTVAGIDDPDPEADYEYSWNPLTNWNHWRQVEEKLSENSELLCEYIDTLMCRTELGNCTVRLVLEDLPTRAKALYIACPSPHANS